MTALRDIIALNRNGHAAALPSVCSAHPEVLRASLLLAEKLDRALIVEATSNQVNQFGGYTGMTPSDFLEHVRSISSGCGCDDTRIIFGGDHLGPQAWRSESPKTAMEKARDMVHAYASAGMTKIHLDCAEGCKGEAEHPGDAVSAERAAQLAEVALDAAPDPDALDFIVGTEVPPPGGARDEGAVQPTNPDAARATMRVHQDAFSDRAAKRIVGLVVQPGVEFGAWDVDHLPSSPNEALRSVIDDFDGVAFEAHSTDYQRPEAYKRLAEMGFAVLKVGPALTFAYREAIYALDLLADIIGIKRGKSVRQVAEDVMLGDPSYWQSHYTGDTRAQHLARHFSYSDRIRYYWPRPELASAVASLREALSGHRPRRPLLLQVFCEDIIDRAEDIDSAQDHVDALILASIQAALRPYFIEESA